MGFDASGHVIAPTTVGRAALKPFYDDGGVVVQRVPFDVYGRRVFIPLAEVTIASFDDGAEVVTITADAVHGQVFKADLQGGPGVVFANLDDDPEGVWSEAHPPDSDPFAALVNTGLFVAPNAGDPDVSGKNIAYRVY